MNEVATVETDMPERATASAARRFSLPSTRILLLIAGVLALLLALYAAAGYLWAPRLIEDQARAWTRENLKQDLAIGDVKGFAFTLGLTTLIDILIFILFTHPVMQLLARTGFDEVVLRGDQSQAFAQKALDLFAPVGFYQGDVAETRPWFLRSSARVAA